MYTFAFNGKVLTMNQYLLLYSQQWNNPHHRKINNKHFTFQKTKTNKKIVPIHYHFSIISLVAMLKEDSLIKTIFQSYLSSLSFTFTKSE